MEDEHNKQKERKSIPQFMEDSRNKEFLKRYSEDARFTESIYNNPTAANQQKINDSFEKLFNITPPRISAPIVETKRKSADGGQQRQYSYGNEPYPIQAKTESIENIGTQTKTYRSTLNIPTGPPDRGSIVHNNEVAQTEFDLEKTIPVPLEVSLQKCRETNTKIPEECMSYCIPECKDLRKTNLQIQTPRRNTEERKIESPLPKHSKEIGSKESITDFETQVQPELNNNYYEKQLQSKSDAKQPKIISSRNTTNEAVQKSSPNISSKSVGCNFCETLDVSTQKFENEHTNKPDTTPKLESTESRKGSKQLNDIETKLSQNCILDCPNKSNAVTKVNFTQATTDDTLKISVPPTTTLNSLSWSVGKKKYDFISPVDNKASEYSKNRRGSTDSKSCSTANSSRQSLNIEEFEAIGRMYACKLKGLETNQRILAEKLISDIFCEAQFNALTKDTKICYNNSSAPSTKNSDVLPVKNKSNSKWEEDLEEQRLLNLERENYVRQSVSQGSDYKKCYRCNKYKRYP